jgi:8-oxo-dGTP diphosphatase
MKLDPINQSTPKNPVGRFMVAAGAVIELNHTGKILLVKRNESLDWHPSEWEITYGRLGQFEDVESGLRREIFEELGINQIEIGKVIRLWHIYRGSLKAENEVIGITYHARTSIPQVKISSEHSEYRWVTPKEALTLIKIEGIIQDIKLFQEIKK